MFNIFRIKNLLMVSGIALTSAGIVGPTVFIDFMGQLNLFQLTEMIEALESMGLPQDGSNMYFWIGTVFAALIVLSLLAALMRLYLCVWLLAVAGLTVWGVSYFLYREWHEQALVAVDNGSAILKTAIQTLDLQWGAWCILSGLVLLVVAAMMRSR